MRKDIFRKLVNKTMKYLFSLILFLLLFVGIGRMNAQVLHTESFSVIIDTSKRIKGSIVPDFKFQNQKKYLIEFENTSDISFRFKNHAITFANKIELSKYGSEVLLSGGYLYVEYRKIFEEEFSLEPYSQLHWSDARGLEFKYAGGIQARYHILQNRKLGFFFGLGPFYEFERWNYDGVKDHLLPANTKKIGSEKIKIGSYISFKWISDFDLTFDFNAYHQSTLNEFFSTPRLASSTSITYNFTDNLGLLLKYENIYDYNPIVPIDKLFNKIIFTIDISF